MWCIKETLKTGYKHNILIFNFTVLIFEHIPEKSNGCWKRCKETENT